MTEPESAPAAWRSGSGQGQPRPIPVHSGHRPAIQRRSTRTESESAGEANSPRPPRCLAQPPRLDIRRTSRAGLSDGGDGNPPAAARGGSTRPGHNIKIELQNIGTLLPKLPDVRAEIYLNQPDIICFTETNLKKSTPDNVLQISGYHLFRRDRIIGRKKSGGGVAIYVKDDIQAELLKTGTSPGESHLEPLWLKIKLDKKRVSILGGLYRPPSSASRQIHADYNHLEKELQSIIAAHPSKRIIMAGDLNSDVSTNPVANSRLLWISDPVRPCFLEITSSNLSQLVSNFHTIHFSPSADIHQYGLLTKYQNLGYLSLTRNVKFRPVHLLVQWRLERRRL